MHTWNIGNTTVRNPERLREALKLFQEKMVGRPFGESEQREFQKHMIEAGLVDSERYGGDDGARKFASAFKQLGFVTDWARGRTWDLTDVGRHLIDNPNIESTIFLRQLLKYQIPSPLERQPGHIFNVRPFRLFLRFLHRAHVENMIGLTKYEIGLYVITTLTENETDFETAFEEIRNFRLAYDALVGRVRKMRFASEELISRAALLSLNPNTLQDYADSSSRYALLSGLLTLRGNKIAISETRLLFISNLLNDGSSLLGDDEYLFRFYDSVYPSLPTDNRQFLTDETATLLQQINNLASSIGDIPSLPQAPAEINLLNLQEYEQALRNEFKRIREISFYRNQSTQGALQEIEDLLENIRDNTLIAGQSYAPAFFEWAIWRLFLAINHIVGDVSTTRGFPIDEDMQPVHHAKGGSADLKFTYQDFVLICEMTLAQGSRQFAMEGEPVTRHISKALAESNNKPVYGLFVAKRIDPNTVDAFHNARYWRNWDSSVPTPVVAIKIDDAINLVRRLQISMITIESFRNWLIQILESQSDFQTGPEWYQGYSARLSANPFADL